MEGGGIGALLALLVLFLPTLLSGVHVIKREQPRIWLLVFCGMPVFGPLLYWLWPVGGASRPRR
ncbi:hypothetical protein [Pelomonas sp. Root1237]|uniref:hypothetical protein n=1 Tax=Pelomonas sp. Root1237 TaxID=1736434 RepID=UPI0006F22427|nr:hypothetical protein [Pelomonas sp. Root1237]KQV87610.1 hypothetical protein ASC91_18610 [Pelomonas sp. Root1237]